jgi:hypothetical protein
MLFHGELGIRPALTIPLFALFRRKGLGGHAIEMFVHALITPDLGIGSLRGSNAGKSLGNIAKTSEGICSHVVGAAGTGPVIPPG